MSRSAAATRPVPLRFERTPCSVRGCPCDPRRAPHGVLCAIELRVNTAGAIACRRRFLRYFPGGFADETYLAWERTYKDDASAAWRQQLGRTRLAALLKAARFDDVAAAALRIESRTNLLFSFEKMALRDAVRTPAGARRFAEGLYRLLHGPGSMEDRFTDWTAAMAALPRRQTRVVTWPAVTVFGFLAQPRHHIFLKPNVTRNAAMRYGFPFTYESRPAWSVYRQLLEFASVIRADVADLGPRDLIDIQSFMWVQGSEEYGGRVFRPVQTTRVKPFRGSVVPAIS